MIAHSPSAAGGLLAGRVPAELEACRYHPGPTAADPAEHARQVREAARSRNESRSPESWFRAGRRAHAVYRKSERLAGRQVPAGESP